MKLVPKRKQCQVGCDTGMLSRQAGRPAELGASRGAKLQGLGRRKGTKLRRTATVSYGQQHLATLPIPR